MSVIKNVFSHKYASDIAIGICKRLQPLCEEGRLNIAGSIRRKKSEVKDIEIVCCPKKITVGGPDLFGNDNSCLVILSAFESLVNSLGEIIKGKPGGRYMQILVDKKIALDLFMPEPYDYFRIYAIRTGSADYSAKVITNGWIRNGWRGTENGLRLEKECREEKYKAGLNEDGTTKYKIRWICDVKEPTLPPVWESERDFFDWIGVQYLAPELRNF